MTKFRLVLLAMILVGVMGAFPEAARAQHGAVKIIFEKFNLLGAFAADCSRGPNSNDNTYYVNRLIDPDHVQRDLMESATARVRAIAIDYAWELTPEMIGLIGIRDDNKPIAEVWRVVDGRMVQWESFFEDKPEISDGKWLKLAIDMPWLNRCHD
jgi:hypothetical protein